MKGFPKFKIGDTVAFKFGDDVKVGIVWVVDKYGTFEDPSDVSYDIMVESENTLYKHFTENLILGKMNN